MYTYSVLSQLPIEDLTKSANSLNVDVLSSNSKDSYIKAILNKQYCILREHISTNITTRKAYSIGLNNIAARLTSELTKAEIELPQHKTHSDPIISTIQSESKKVNKALELIKQASELLADCEVDINNYHQYTNK